MIIKMQIKDILDYSKLTEQVGLNVWCVNEGLADGDEFIEVEVEDVNVI